MPVNTRTRLYRITGYDLFVYATTKKKAKTHFENATGLKAGKISWSRYKKIKLSLSQINVSHENTK